MRALGVLLLLGVLAGLVWLTAVNIGVKGAIFVWGLSLGLTALIGLAIWLIVYGDDR